MKKIRLPIWLVCLIFVAATLLMNLRYWIPVTEDSGEHYTLTLENASANKSTIFLSFDHKANNFRLPYSKAFEPLLEADAFGKEYNVIADYKPGGRRGRSYYDVYALSGADGAVYLTVEQSEASELIKRSSRIIVNDCSSRKLLKFEKLKFNNIGHLFYTFQAQIGYMKYTISASFCKNDAFLAANS